MSSNSQTNNPDRRQSVLNRLGQKRETLFRNRLAEFEVYLQTKAKDPLKEDGYAEKSIPTRISRVVAVIDWIWNKHGVSLSISTEQADEAMKALKTNDLTRIDGQPFSGNSKRKMGNALENWFQLHETDYSVKVSFDESGEASEQADPFTKNEIDRLWEAALDYKTIPSYNNLSPDERDRWRKHLAQELGKPQDQVNPDDWKKVNTNWKIPSIVGTTKSAAWRPAFFERCEVDWYNPASQTIVVPAEHAVKTQKEWTQHLSDDAAFSLDRWLEQRSNIAKYDDSSKIWLTRKSNPYSSSSLNDLLDDLIDEAGINIRGRTLVWYSWRHTLGTYLYDEYRDLEIVAENLRHSNLSTAKDYVHPTEELLAEAASVL